MRVKQLITHKTVFIHGPKSHDEDDAIRDESRLRRLRKHRGRLRLQSIRGTRTTR